MKTLINFIFLIIGLLFLSCQKLEQITYPEYYRNFQQVEQYLDSNEIELAVSKFDSISNKIPHLPSSDLFKMARMCANNNYCDLAVKYLKQSLINGQEYGKGIGPYKIIEGCKNEIAQILLQESEIHKHQFNYKYKSQIDSMFQADQKARIESDFEKVRVIDSMNMINLLSYINELGYPSEKLIGHASAQNAFVMLLHMDRDKNNKIFKPILDKAYNEGQIWPRGYAWIIDRRRAWGEEKLEPYYYHMPSKEFENYSKEQINEINIRRDSIGLEPK